MDAMQCDVDLMSLNSHEQDVWMHLGSETEEGAKLQSESGPTFFWDTATKKNESVLRAMDLLKTHMAKGGEEWMQQLKAVSFTAETEGGGGGDARERDWKALTCPRTMVEASHREWVRTESRGVDPHLFVAADPAHLPPRSLQAMRRTTVSQASTMPDFLAKALTRRTLDAVALRKALSKYIGMMFQDREETTAAMVGGKRERSEKSGSEKKPSVQQQKKEMPVWLKVATMPSGQVGVVDSATNQVLSPSMPGAPALGIAQGAGVKVHDLPEIPRAMCQWRKLPRSQECEQLLVRAVDSNKIKKSSVTLVATVHPSDAMDCQKLDFTSFTKESEPPCLVLPPTRSMREEVTWPVCNVIMKWEGEKHVAIICEDNAICAAGTDWGVPLRFAMLRMWFSRRCSGSFTLMSRLPDGDTKPMSPPIPIADNTYNLSLALSLNMDGRWCVMANGYSEPMDGTQTGIVLALAPLLRPDIAFAAGEADLGATKALGPFSGSRTKRAEDLGPDEIEQLKKTMIANGCRFHRSLAGMQAPEGLFHGGHIPSELGLTLGLGEAEYKREVTCVTLGRKYDVKVAQQLLAVRADMLTWATIGTSVEVEEEEDDIYEDDSDMDDLLKEELRDLGKLKSGKKEKGKGKGRGKGRKKSKKDTVGGGSSLANMGLEEHMLPALTHRVKVEAIHLSVDREKQPNYLYEAVRKEATCQAHWGTTKKLVRQWLTEVLRDWVHTEATVVSLGIRAAQMVCTSDQLDAAEGEISECPGAHFMYALAYAARPLWLYNDGEASNTRDFSKWMELGAVVANLICALATPDATLDTAMTVVAHTEPMLLAAGVRPLLKYVAWFPQPLQSYIRLVLCYHMGEVVCNKDAVDSSPLHMLDSVEERRAILRSVLEYNTVKNTSTEIPTALFRCMFWKTLAVPELRDQHTRVVNAWLAFAESMGARVRLTNHYFMRRKEERSGDKGRENRRRWCRRIPGCPVRLQDHTGMRFVEESRGLTEDVLASFATPPPSKKHKV